ncbi:MAG: AAA ATPase [Watsoniomyces obsoletus]|nr:MAG: AAA ATPase [Watsoniomyces obsoletus]
MVSSVLGKRSRASAAASGTSDIKIKRHATTTTSSTTTVTPTPQTPRRRDALSKPQQQNGSATPFTPRHRVALVGKPLFSTPRLLRTPSTPSTTLPTVYHSARQLFVRSANPGRLVGRQHEREELRVFLQGRMEKKTGGCLYVSGPPGTGKSALVQEVVHDEELDTGMSKKAYLNCMSVRSGQDLFTKLMEELDLDQTVSGSAMDVGSVLRQTFLSRKSKAQRKTYIVVLDEVDHLLTLELEVVYNLFEWALSKSSQLVLVGIANALDFTDRFLPRLKARNLTPQLLPFLPYAAAQINSVITTKLRSLLSEEDRNTTGDGYVPFIHPSAIQLCAKKVASQTGDIRKAFDICRRAVDLIESETKQKYHQQQQQQIQQETPPRSEVSLEFSSPQQQRAPLTENMNLCSSSPTTPNMIHSPMLCHPNIARRLFTTTASASTSTSTNEPLRGLTPETAPRATIAHIARISASSFGNGISQRLQTLNLQQKAVLCSLVSLEKKKRRARAVADVLVTPSKLDRSAPTVRALFETYTNLCKRDGMLHPLTSTEFRDVVGSLETLSLITPVDGKTGGIMGLGSKMMTMTPSKRGRKGGLGMMSTGKQLGDDQRIGCCVGEKELENAVEGVGKGILKGLLVDDDDDEEEDPFFG